MTTFLFTHRDCLFHDTGDGHPERADRLRSVLHRLDLDKYPELQREEAPLAERQTLELAHTAAYLDHVDVMAPAQGIVALDPDTKMSPGSKSAALRGAGATCAAIDRVMTEIGSNAFCAIRPPGHHAEADRAMGFCLYNNVVIGAHYARKQYGIQRVAVIDFDVHHGNGTQSMFETDPDLFYGSTHQAPYYPGTGAASETGTGNIFNVPLKAGDGWIQFKAAMEEVILPALKRFDPELLLISAGFDAHVKDPLADINLETEDYTWITDQLMDIADTHCEGRLVSLLEGGYDLDGLSEGVGAHVNSLLRRS
ncbi:MAG: histone deacetylase family protein [Proteobacteria bacterium]|nr:histone deacetylase family protein [Pseudomonadota bacterium]